MKKIFSLLAALIVCTLLVVGAAYLGGTFDQKSDGGKTSVENSTGKGKPPASRFITN